jgi:hypothetical protein
MTMTGGQFSLRENQRLCTMSAASICGQTHARQWKLTISPSALSNFRFGLISRLYAATCSVFGPGSTLSSMVWLMPPLPRCYDDFAGK